MRLHVLKEIQVCTRKDIHCVTGNFSVRCDGTSRAIISWQGIIGLYVGGMTQLSAAGRPRAERDLNR